MGGRGAARPLSFRSFVRAGRAYARCECDGRGAEAMGHSGTDASLLHAEGPAHASRTARRARALAPSAPLAPPLELKNLRCCCTASGDGGAPRGGFGRCAAVRVINDQRRRPRCAARPSHAACLAASVRTALSAGGHASFSGVRTGSLSTHCRSFCPAQADPSEPVPQPG
eukprot:364161-Chlamydomonas_euryale.AAC.3